MRWMRRWLGLAHEGACVGCCGNDGGGGDCEADGREATGSTGRGGHVTQERNSVSDYVFLQYFGEPERASDV